MYDILCMTHEDTETSKSRRSNFAYDMAVLLCPQDLASLFAWFAQIAIGDTLADLYSAAVPRESNVVFTCYESTFPLIIWICIFTYFHHVTTHKKSLNSSWEWSKLGLLNHCTAKGAKTDCTVPQCQNKNQKYQNHPETHNLPKDLTVYGTVYKTNGMCCVQDILPSHKALDLAESLSWHRAFPSLTCRCHGMMHA